MKKDFNIKAQAGWFAFGLVGWYIVGFWMFPLLFIWFLWYIYSKMTNWWNNRIDWNRVDRQVDEWLQREYGDYETFAKEWDDLVKKSNHIIDNDEEARSIYMELKELV